VTYDAVGPPPLHPEYMPNRNNGVVFFIDFSYTFYTQITIITKETCTVTYHYNKICRHLKKRYRTTIKADDIIDRFF